MSIPIRQHEAVLEVIRLAPDDWRQWRVLRRAALAEAPEVFGSTLADWSGPGDTEQRWRSRLQSVPYNIVVRRDEEPAGMASGTMPGPDGVVELISLWVSPTARGHGVGAAAVGAVVEWAQAAYPGHRVAASVKTHNEPALALFRRSGFLDAGVSPDGPDERRLVRHP